MPWFVISTFDDDDMVTWRAIDTPFRTIDDAWEAISKEISASEDHPGDEEVTGKVHVIEAKSMRKALDSLDLVN